MCSRTAAGNEGRSAAAMQSALPQAKTLDGDPRLPEWHRGNDEVFMNIHATQPRPQSRDDDPRMPDWHRGNEDNFMDIRATLQQGKALDGDPRLPDWHRGNDDDSMDIHATLPRLQSRDDDPRMPDWHHGNDDDFMDIQATLRQQKGSDGDPRMPRWHRGNDDDFMDLPAAQRAPGELGTRSEAKATATSVETYVPTANAATFFLLAVVIFLGIRGRRRQAGHSQQHILSARRRGLRWDLGRVGMRALPRKTAAVGVVPVVPENGALGVGASYFVLTVTRSIVAETPPRVQARTPTKF